MSDHDSKVLVALKSALEASSILQPGSANYEKENSSYFSAFENELKPLFVAQPKSAAQAQGLIQALRPLVISGDVQIAIRGAGHTPFAGSANIQNGVTIDLRGLKGITLSEDKSTVDIGVGETWTTVYTELERQGLTVPGARTGHIGVPGFILGGKSASP